MRRKSVTRIIGIVALLSAVPALAHKVPWNSDDPAFDSLRDDLKGELTYNVARFCHITGQSPEDCVKDVQKNTQFVMGSTSLFSDEKISNLLPNDLKEQLGRYAGKANNHKLLAALSECMKDVGEPNPELDLISHKIGVPSQTCANESSQCFWHENYREQGGRDGWGVHRHEYSAALRDRIADKYALERLSEYIKNYNVETTSTSKTTGHTVSGEMGVSGSVKLVEGSVTANGSHTGGSSQSRSLQGPTKEQRDQEFSKAYDRAYNNPQHFAPDATPDVLCQKGKAVCEIGPGLSYANRDEQVKDDSPKYDAKTSRDDSPKYDSKTSLPPPPPRIESPTSNKNDGIDYYKPERSTPKRPQSKLKITPTDMHDFKRWVLGCVNDKLKPELTMNIEPSDDPTDSLPLKQRAELLLKRGTCLEEYYGESYCREFRSRGWITYAPPELDQPKPEGTLVNPQNEPTILPSAEMEHERYCAELRAQMEARKREDMEKGNAPMDTSRNEMVWNLWKNRNWKDEEDGTYIYSKNGSRFKVKIPSVAETEALEKELKPDFRNLLFFGMPQMVDVEKNHMAFRENVPSLDKDGDSRELGEIYKWLDRDKVKKDFNLEEQLYREACMDKTSPQFDHP